MAGHSDWGPQTVTVVAGQVTTVTATLATTPEPPQPTDPEPTPPPPSVDFGLGLESMDDQAYGLIRVIRADPVSVPSSVDISADFPVPGNQGRQGSCVGWAVAYALKSFQERIERRWSLTDDRHIMSPAYVYNQIKNPNRGGARIVDALNLLVDQGVSSLATMPYGDDTDEPSEAAKREAADYKIADWGRVERLPLFHSRFVREIKRHLTTKRPVIIGIQTRPDFDSLKPANPVYDDVSGHNRGGHAVVIVGYDDARSAFKIINSWGTNNERWGIDGYGWIDYTASRTLITQAFVAVDVVATDVRRPPEAASGPVPGNAAVGVAAGAATTTLSWTRNERTTSFDVYVGTDSALDALDFQSNVSQPTFRVPVAPGSTYYWRIDAHGAGGLTRGSVWSFTTAGSAEPPLKPTNPRPANGATAVSGDASLNWDSGGRATSYDVYLGTTASLGSSDRQRTQATRTFNPDALVAGTRYYWRIDAKNSRGTTRGDTWSFTTAGPARALSIADARATEGRSLTFTVTLSAASASTVTVQYRTGDGTARSSDYTSASGTLRFAARETRKTISVRTTDDTRDENDESFYVYLRNASGATISDERATGTIVDNDGAQPSLSIADARATEGRSLTFTVTLSAASASTVTVQYRTGNGTASSSSDYTSASGTLRFAAGETRKTISVRTTDDTRVEATELFYVYLLNASGATISDGQATGTIIDNDYAQPSLSIADARATEGRSLTFTVTLSAASASTVSVQYRTGNGTASSSDYTSASGTLRFAARETRKTISVRTTDDTRDENNESFYVYLRNASGATISDERATGTIIDNDDSDHGDSRSTAHVLSNCGSDNRAWRINGSLTRNDYDYFKLQCDDGRGSIRAWTTGSTDTYGVLQYGNGDTADNNDDSGAGDNFRLGISELVGTFYVEVKGRRSSTTGSYVLHVEWRPDDAPDGINDGTASLRPGSPRYLYLYNNDEDWLSFSLHGSGCANVRITSSIESRIRSYYDTDPDGQLRTRSGLVRDMRDYGRGHIDIAGKVRKGGTRYWVRVWEHDRGTGPYVLNLTTSDSLTCIGAKN